jgi:hypothetical protein
MFEYFKRVLALLESINSALWYIAEQLDRRSEVDVLEDMFEDTV